MATLTWIFLIMTVIITAFITFKLTSSYYKRKLSRVERKFPPNFKTNI